MQASQGCSTEVIDAQANHNYFSKPYAALNKYVLRAVSNVVMKDARETDSG